MTTSKERDDSNGQIRKKNQAAAEETEEDPESHPGEGKGNLYDSRPLWVGLFCQGCGE